MGMADAVPGVSGGTIAFILGIYPELLASLRSPTSSAFWQALRKGKIGEVWQLVQGNFLLALGLGILSAVIAMAAGLEPLLEHHPVQVWSFFFGLIAASFWVVAKRVSDWNALTIGLVLVTSVAMFWLVSLRPAHTPESWWFLILSGMIAVVALILPGISGALILVLMGKYEFIVNAVSERDIGALLLLVVGGVIGLLSLARALSWLFAHFERTMLAIICGLILGSLRSVYPWQSVTSVTQEEATAGTSQLLLPPSFSSFALALGLALLGFVVVWGLEKLAQSSER